MLVVDNFGVKYIGEEHALHLKRVIEEHYEVKYNWKGERHLGLTLN